MSPETAPSESTPPGIAPTGAEESAGARVPGFSVALPQFEGPFDLLLTLIARKRLDVTELALAEVTDDFVALMRSDWDLGQASEFLVVAATLLALKAHRLLPHDPEDEEEADLELLEARDLLFARLLQYRAYKEAAAQLRRLSAGAERSHPRSASLPAELAALMPRLVAATSPQELARAAAAALSRPGPPGVQTVHLHERVPVGEQMGLIVDRLRDRGPLTFSELTADAERVSVVVARFLALLLLHRQGRVDLEQEEPMAEITVSWCGGEEEGAGIMSPEAEEEFG